MSSGALFIAGMSRSGTTWLARTLNEHPDVAVFGETAFWGTYFVRPARDGKYSPAQLVRVLSQLEKNSLSSLPHAAPGGLKKVTPSGIGSLLRDAVDTKRPLAPGELFTNVAQAIAQAEGKLLAVEKTPHHVNWLDRIIKYLPEAKFAVLVRDPYGFMLSYKHQGDRKPAGVRATFRALYNPIGCSLVWRGYARAAARAAARYPQQVRMLRFEDIESSPEELLLEVEGFFGLRAVDLTRTGDGERVNSSFPSGHRPALVASDVLWMNAIAASEIRALGYARRAAPVSLGALLLPIVRLPFWGVRALTTLRKRVPGSLLVYVKQWLR